MSGKWVQDFKRGFRLHPEKEMAIGLTIAGFLMGFMENLEKGIIGGLVMGFVVWSIVLFTSPSVGMTNPNE